MTIKPQKKKARSQNHNLIALNNLQGALSELEIWGSDSQETEFCMTSLRVAIYHLIEEIKNGEKIHGARESNN